MDINITKQAIESLNKRLNTSENYTQREVNSVSTFDHRLINTNLDDEGTILLRNLCAASIISKSLIIKKSHRPLIGPIIFLIKRLIRKVATPLFKVQFDQIENFNQCSVLAIAKLYNKNSER